MYANFQLSDVMVKKICEGVEGSGVRCGVIGEVGISWPMTDFEKRSLKASALAQQQTGRNLLRLVYISDHHYAPSVCLNHSLFGICIL